MKETIKTLLQQRNAIMLAHNYQPPEIQEMADLCGDSLELSLKAAKTDADVILFCGVHFMAETAAILSPQKTVLLPRKDAGCPMADMITPAALRSRLKQSGPLPVVTYVNSPAAVKALSTICCTSANVVRVVESLPEKTIMLTPDRNLARYAAGRSDKTILMWDGYCPVHEGLSRQQVIEARAAHPAAVFMAHPECREEVLDLADAVLSTSGMIRFAGESTAERFLVGTEIGLLHPLQKAHPGKTFIPVSTQMVCPDMKKITLSDVFASLDQMAGIVEVAEEIRKPALQAVQRMLALSG